MTKIPEYTYLGENGTIVSSVLLDLYHTTKYYLLADSGKLLTNDGKHFVKNVLVTKSELNEWYEVNE